MWLKEVRPELERRSDGQVLVTRTLKTLGIGEGTVDEMARPLYSTPDIGIGTYARQDGVHLRIGAKGATREEAWSRIRPVEEELDLIFGQAIWGRDEDTLEGAIADMLHARNETVAVMESATGGFVSSTLTDVPGATGYYDGGLITYTAQHKIDAGVPPEIITMNGIVSQETAKAMATAVRERFRSSYGLGITGVLGPDPMEDVAPGTVHVAVATPQGDEHVMTMTMNQGTGGREAAGRDHRHPAHAAPSSGRIARTRATQARLRQPRPCALCSPTAAVLRGQSTQEHSADSSSHFAVCGSSSKCATDPSSRTFRALNCAEVSRHEGRRWMSGITPKYFANHRSVSLRACSPRAESTLQSASSIAARKPSLAPGIGFRNA